MMQSNAYAYRPHSIQLGIVACDTIVEVLERLRRGAKAEDATLEGVLSDLDEAVAWLEIKHSQLIGIEQLVALADSEIAAHTLLTWVRHKLFGTEI